MARLFKSDHSRRIELEGFGAAPRPVDIDQAQTGFGALKTLRIYRFEPVGVVHGHAEEDEVFIVVLGGRIELQMKSRHWSDDDRCFILEAADGSAPVACAAYLPPHAEYTLTPQSAADVAYARALPGGGRSPAVFHAVARPEGRGARLWLDESTHAERLRMRLWRVDARDGGAGVPAAGVPAAGAPAADLWPADLGAAVARETLIHVRSSPSHAVTVDAPGLHGVALDSWDTLALSPGERPQLRVAAPGSATALEISAA